MSAPSFQCSACNAPLVVRGRSALIVCPYCQTSVVVPEALRLSGGDTSSWHTLVFDTFTSNENAWLVGSRASEYFTTLNQTLADAHYRWEAEVGKPYSISTTWLMGYSVTDFHLGVHCKRILGNKVDSAWGVIFRAKDSQNYGWFRMTDSGLFSVSAMEKGEWRWIVEWERTDAIKPNGVNHLEVIASKNHFSFLINSQLIGEAEDDSLVEGYVGLAIEGYPTGAKATFDFLDFLLRAPKPQPND